jgi:hypothetical protein
MTEDYMLVMEVQAKQKWKRWVSIKKQSFNHDLNLQAQPPPWQEDASDGEDNG